MKRLFSAFILLITTIGVIAQNTQPQYVSLTTSAEFTDGEAYYTTFSSTSPLDFTELSSDVRAYVITKMETKRSETIIYLDFVRYTLDAISVKSVTTVPANTGVLVKTKRPGTYRIPVATGPVANVKSDLIPVGTVDADVSDILNSYVDDVRYYYVPYSLEVRDNTLAFYAKKSTFLGNGEGGVEDVFASGEVFLKKNTAVLMLDYWEDMDAYGADSSAEFDPGNSTGKVDFEAKGDFDEEPNYTYTFIDMPIDNTDGVWNYTTYFNKDQDLDFTDVENLKAYIVVVDSTEYTPKGVEESEQSSIKVANRIFLKSVNKVPAATPLVLRAPRSDAYRVPLLEPGARIDNVSENALDIISTETDMADMLNAMTPIYPYLLKSTTGYTGFGPNLPDSMGAKYNEGEKILSAGTVFLPIDSNTHNYLQLCDYKYLRFGSPSIIPQDNQQPPVVVNHVDINISGHAANDDNYYATFYTGDTPLDFTETDQLTAYKLTSENTQYYPKAEERDSSVVLDVIGRIDLKQLGIAPPGTTIIVRAEKAGTYQVPEAVNKDYTTITDNLLENAYEDIDVDEMAKRNTPLYVYSLQFNNEKAGFAFHQGDEEAGRNILHKGDAYIVLSANDHEYVQKSIQKYLPFGTALKLPEIVWPDTLKPDTLKPDTTIVKHTITIDINGLVANATGNFVTFISPDHALDFTQVNNASAFIVTATEEQRDGQTIISRIDLKEVKRIAAATPIVIIADIPGEIEVPEAEGETPLDSTEGNVLQAVPQPAEGRSQRGGAPESEAFAYILSSDGDGNVGFYYRASTMAPGTVYMLLSAAAHQFVNETYQLGLPFGVSLEVNGISGITTEQATATAVYSISGQKSHRLQHGVNIIRLSNGKTLKRIVR